MSGRLDYRIVPGTPLTGRIRVPGDKSISHRALLLAAMAQGESRIEGLSTGADVQATARALRALGVAVEARRDGVWHVRGDALRAPEAPLELGNSGTSARLLLGLLAGRAFQTTLRGDVSLSRRPMQRVLDPLRRMGARFRAAAGDTLPVTLHPGTGLRGIHYRCPMPSAQLKSALLLAGLGASGRTVVEEPLATRDHTERLLERFGCPPPGRAAAPGVPSGGRILEVQGGTVLTGTHIEVPGDFSAAAFFLAGACLVPGSDLCIEGVGVNPTRTAALEVLRAMGAHVEVANREERFGEPTATLRVRHVNGLRPMVIEPELAARAIDELPVLLAVSASLQGHTRLRGAAELRCKESDRIQAVQDGLAALGIHARALPDGLHVDGARPRGGTVQSHCDHRIVMAFSMLALSASAPVRIVDCRWVETSFPGFASLARCAGMELREEQVA